MERAMWELGHGRGGGRMEVGGGGRLEGGGGVSLRWLAAGLGGSVGEG